MSENKQLLFFSKCRPEGIDLWDISEKYRRVFIGYPVWKSDLDYNKEILKWRDIGFKDIVINLNLAHEVWKKISKNSDGKSVQRQVTENRNLALEVDTGSVVLVPRPELGVCYAGVIENKFELVNYPEWADEYIELIKSKKNISNSESAESRLGNVVYSWTVEKWKTLNFVAMPRWISYRLLSRKTIGIINDLDEPEHIPALGTILKMMGCNYREQFGLLHNVNTEIALLNWVSPELLEHLMVELFQLENAYAPYWHHVGGSGDGGVDGIGINHKGEVVALLQCKWHYSGDLKHEVNKMGNKYGDDVMRIVAVLHGKPVSPRDEDKFKLWNGEKIAKLFDKHSSSLNIAKAVKLVN